jgi:hypothetical protein
MPEQRDVQRGAHPQIRRVLLDRGQRLAVRPRRLLLLRREPLATAGRPLMFPVLRGRAPAAPGGPARACPRSARATGSADDHACPSRSSAASPPTRSPRCRSATSGTPSASRPPFLPCALGSSLPPGIGLPVFGSIPADRNELRSDCAALRRELRSCCSLRREIRSRSLSAAIAIRNCCLRCRASSVSVAVVSASNAPFSWRSAW